MGFFSGTYTRAFEIKKAERYNAEAQYEKAISELKTANPRFTELEMEQQNVAARMAIAAISGDKKALETLRAKSEEIAKEKQKLLGGTTFPQIEYTCKNCNDTGYINGKICPCVVEIAKKMAYKELSEEMPLDTCRFDNFDLKYYKDKAEEGVSPKKRMTQVLKICREFSLKFKENGQNLLLLGKTGLGKTHLSLAIANEAVASGSSVIYGSAQNLINKAAGEQFSYSGSTEVIDSLLGCDLLIIDDLGTEMSTSFSQSCIYNIINTRILKKLPTVISTNLTLSEIAEKYTPRVSSRIMGSYTLLQFLGADIRQQKALANMK